MYASGIIGDKFEQRKILCFAYLALSICFMLQAVGGFVKITHQAFYYTLFILIGFFNSMIFPNFISVLGNWFTKKRSGFMIGLWATCNNVGNIAGI